MQFSSLDELLKQAVAAGAPPEPASEGLSADELEELRAEIDDSLAKEAAHSASSRTGVAKLMLAIDLLSKTT